MHRLDLIVRSVAPHRAKQSNSFLLPQTSSTLANAEREFRKKAETDTPHRLDLQLFQFPRMVQLKFGIGV
jgi:hypothetical protein